MAKQPVQSLRLHALGDACITTPLARIEPSSEILFAAALYLAVERREPVSRRALQAVLWPEASDRVASHRMRQTLLKLRQLGVPIEVRGKGSISLAADSVTVDYEEFLAARKGVERTSNDALVMLPAYEPRFSEPYLEWLDARKAEVNASMTRMMLGIIARYRVKGEWAETELNASRLLRFQPYNEEATLAMAEACAMRGGKLDATRILDRYLSEVGSGPTDLRLPATIMRRRIADRMHPRAEAVMGESPLVGRGATLEQLGELLERSRRTRGQACLVWGDAGVGKSRLLAEFATFASLQGIPTQRVQCRPSDPHRPLSVFVDLVPGLRAMRGAIGCEPETFNYLDRLTKHRATKIEIRAEEGDSEFIYGKVQQSLFDLLDAVSEEGCLIVLIEDVHWVDSTSAKVLRDMIAWAADHSILFAFTGRDQPEAWLAHMPGRLTEIHLPPLEPGPSRDVVLGVVRQHGREIDDAHLEWYIKIAEGNPYFLQELANQWIETGEQNKVPLSLTAVLNERITRIHGDTLQVLQACSVLDKNSTFDRIEVVLGFEAHRMLSAINELANAGMLLVEPTESDNGTATRFCARHDLLSNAALARLATPALAFLHRRVGAALEKEIHEPSSAAILWDCAKHWQLAGDIGRAFTLASSCAAHLLEMGLPSAAADAYEKSLAYCSNPDQRLEMLEGLAHASYHSGAWERVGKAVVMVRRIEHIVRPHKNQHDELELMDLTADWRKQRLELTLVRALECLRAESASANHRVQAGGTALMLADLACDHDAMRHTYDVIATLYQNADVAVSSKLRADMVFHCVCGDVLIGVSSAHELVREHKTRGRVGDIFNSLCNTSVSCRTAGLFDDAEAALLEALSVADQHRLTHSRPAAWEMLANLALELGKTQEARQWFQLLKATPLGLGDFNAALNVGGIAARLALIDKRYAQARRLTASGLKQTYADQVTHRKSYRLALVVAARLESGGPIFEQAVEALEETHRRSRVNARQAFPTFVLYRGLQRMNRRNKATRLLNDYLTKYRREPWAPGTHLLDSLPT
jgi:DNA-binding SARP family transcriptional activator/tetratricopeptide (TPR) repeat protein